MRLSACQLAPDVLRALIDIQHDDTARYAQELAAFHADLTGGRFLPTGSLYFARMQGLPGYVKISCTRYSHPERRLAELSRYTDEPLVLIACVSTNNPFFLEQAVHARLSSLRGFAGDPCTEFFYMEDPEAYAQALLFSSLIS